VIEAMLRDELNVGGEQSGHMIFRDYSTTGDGIVSALQILRIMVETGQPLSELRKCLAKYPQAQRNLKVREKRPIEELPGVVRLIAETETELAGAGRVLLRYSGTESKIRLLIEGRDGERINAQADRIADVIQEAIGV
jgi:phosphoglucosamine mutase